MYCICCHIDKQKHTVFVAAACFGGVFVCRCRGRPLKDGLQFKRCKYSQTFENASPGFLWTFHQLQWKTRILPPSLCMSGIKAPFQVSLPPGASSALSSLCRTLSIHSGWIIQLNYQTLCSLYHLISAALMSAVDSSVFNFSLWTKVRPAWVLWMHQE